MKNVVKFVETIQKVDCQSHSIAAIMCVELTAPANGQIAYSTDQTPDFDFGTVVTYTCDRGYGISGGDSERLCGGDGSTSNGMWSEVAPSCERKEKTCLIHNI